MSIRNRLYRVGDKQRSSLRSPFNDDTIIPHISCRHYLRKYVDETYHIENDYLYSLDVRRFNIVPDNYIADAERYVADERARFDFATE